MTVALGESLPPVLRDGSVARHVKVANIGYDLLRRWFWCTPDGKRVSTFDGVSLDFADSFPDGVYPVRRRASEWVITVLEDE